MGQMMASLRARLGPALTVAPWILATDCSVGVSARFLSICCLTWGLPMPKLRRLGRSWPLWPGPHAMADDARVATTAAVEAAVKKCMVGCGGWIRGWLE